MTPDRNFLSRGHLCSPVLTQFQVCKAYCKLHSGVSMFELWFLRRFSMDMTCPSRSHRSSPASVSTLFVAPLVRSPWQYRQGKTRKANMQRQCVESLREDREVCKTVQYLPYNCGLSTKSIKSVVKEEATTFECPIVQVGYRRSALWCGILSFKNPSSSWRILSRPCHNLGDSPP